MEREIINHRQLQHDNIVAFKEVRLTPTSLAIVMEYAAGGELFSRVCAKGRFSEDEARYFFQQLISGVSYCHTMSICHRDLKLENTLLGTDGRAPRLKICDFGYSKSGLINSQPKSTVGTPAYIAPEVLRPQAGGTKRCARRGRAARGASRFPLPPSSRARSAAAAAPAARERCALLPPR